MGTLGPGWNPDLFRCTLPARIPVCTSLATYPIPRQRSPSIPTTTDFPRSTRTNLEKRQVANSVCSNRCLARRRRRRAARYSTNPTPMGNTASAPAYGYNNNNNNNGPPQEYGQTNYGNGAYGANPPYQQGYNPPPGPPPNTHGGYKAPN